MLGLSAWAWMITYPKTKKLISNNILENISENCYINYILNFFTQTSTHIPHELSLQVKMSDFTWTKHPASNRVLRLMPKILKMKTISRSNLPILTSRGIKSALYDPDKAVQKTLDKIYGHLLHYVKQSFTSKFNLMSPSVNRIDEVIMRIKASKTGEWELEGDFSYSLQVCFTKGKFHIWHHSF